MRCCKKCIPVEEKTMLKKIALGSVQFGLEYGINKKSGRLDKKEVFSILDSAYEEGIDILDTAYAYGESEKIIGDFISSSGKEFSVISKAPDMADSNISKYFQETLARLKKRSVYGYLIHKFDNVVTYQGLWGKLEGLKKQGLVSKIGLSLYREEELEYLIDNDMRFDLIQVPYNIFDQRFEAYFPALKERGVEVYTRSVFLQGFFFLDMNRISRHFKTAENSMKKLYQISEAYGLPVRSLCLCFSLLNKFIDRVIIGVDSIEQLKQNVNSLNDAGKVKNIYTELKSLKFHNEEIILPYNWK